jgi:hypothetical protein
MRAEVCEPSDTRCLNLSNPTPGIRKGERLKRAPERGTGRPAHHGADNHQAPVRQLDDPSPQAT